MKDHNLTYWHKTTPDKKLLAARISQGNYRVFNPETGEICHMTSFMLNKEHRPDKANRGASLRTYGRKSRVPKTLTKAFREYLSGVSA